MNVRWQALALLMMSAATGCAAREPATTSVPGRQQEPASELVDSEPVTSTAGDLGNAPRPPDFELDVIDGTSFRLSDHLGQKVVLLDFWATYCDPCLAAMPHLNDLYESHKDDGLLVVGISIDGPETLAQVRATVSRLGVGFPILLDDESSVVALYNPKVSAPFSVLIGRDGGIITKREGYTTGKARALDTDIEQALNR